jgi:hypothetical protein
MSVEELERMRERILPVLESAQRLWRDLPANAPVALEMELIEAGNSLHRAMDEAKLAIKKGDR